MAIEFFDVAYIIAGVCSLGATALSIWMMYKHMQHYSEPRIQIYLVRIIMMVPIYTVDSFFSLVLKDYAMYFDLARDCYEAYVLFMFFRLLIELANGEEALINQLEELPQIKYTAPLCCFHIKPGRIFLHRCKQMILQYVLFKPILALATFLLQITDTYDEGNFAPNRGYLWISLFYNISITLSLYFLVLFYEATKDILKPFKPLSKFLCIKAVIFFSFWQGVAIAGLVHFGILIHAKDDWSTGEVARGLQDFLICVEMLPLSAFHLRTFGHQSFEKQLGGSILHNFAEVANVADVFRDTIESCKKGPQRNVIAGDFLYLNKEQQLERVVKQGWIQKRGEDLAKIWKKRYCVLITEPKGIVYFKFNPFEEKKGILTHINIPIPTLDLSIPNLPSFTRKLKARGFVDFNKLNDVKLKKKSFGLVTPMRTWKFKCTSTTERDEWVAAIYSVAENLVNKETGNVSLEDV